MSLSLSLLKPCLAVALQLLFLGVNAEERRTADIRRHFFAQLQLVHLIYTVLVK
jgi:hypothetical protein